MLASGGGFVGSKQREVGIVFALPDEAIKDVVSQLRQRQQWHEDQLQTADLPGAAEEPGAILPDAAIPEQLFDVSNRPQARQKQQRPARKDAVDAAPTSLLIAVPA